MIVQPFHEGKIVGKSPETDHRRMDMGVYQTGHDNRSRGIQYLFRAVFREVSPFPPPFFYKEDFPVLYADYRIFDHLHWFRHGEYRSAGDEDVGFTISFHFVIPRLFFTRSAIFLTFSIASFSFMVKSCRFSITTFPFIKTVSTSAPLTV